MNIPKSFFPKGKKGSPPTDLATKEDVQTLRELIEEKKEEQQCDVSSLPVHQKRRLIRYLQKRSVQNGRSTEPKKAKFAPFTQRRKPQ